MTHEPRLLMTTQTFDSARDAEPEAEPVLVSAHDDLVDLQLDDGRVLRFDRAELRAAIDDGHAQAA
jgi:hypothetical protein